MASTDPFTFPADSDAALSAAENAPRFWPEPLRDIPRTASFPWGRFLLALLPGTLAALVIAVPLILLRIQAGKQIVFETDSGSLMAVQADGTRSQLISESPFDLPAAKQAELDQRMMFSAQPYWSPAGDQLVATVADEPGVQVAILKPNSPPLTLKAPTVSYLAASPDAWSPTGRYLALHGYDNIHSLLFVYDTATVPPTAEPPPLIQVALTLNSQASMSWHPSGERLLVTALPDGQITSELQKVSIDGSLQSFKPIDGQVTRGDGVYSPDGNRIAYIGSGSRREAGEPLVGTLWVADADGSRPIQLTDTEDAIAPFWDPLGVNIYFTRSLTGATGYVLFRIPANGHGIESQVGPSNDVLLRRPLDRSLWITWSGSSVSPTPIITRRSLPITRQFSLQGTIVAQLQGTLPLLGVPSWSPNGAQLATTNWTPAKLQASLYRSDSRALTPILSTSALMAVPTDGWSPDSRHLALIEHDSARALLTLLNVTQGTSIPFDFSVDTRAGLAWRPDSQGLLLTTHTNEQPTPQLTLVGIDGATVGFAPADGQLFHADGTWSPDGLSVAYVAGDTFTKTVGMLAGSLWIADGNAANPRAVASGRILAPVWDPGGQYLYFTRFLTETASFELFRVLLTGGVASGEEWIGPSSESLVNYPLDRSQFLAWNHDHSRLLFSADKPLPPPTNLNPLVDPALRDKIRANLPLMGVAQWSPYWTYFIRPIVREDKVAVELINPQANRITMIISELASSLALPADGWSLLDDLVVLVGYDGTNARLLILNTTQLLITSVDVHLDTRAGLDWHPTESLLLVTASTAEVLTPTLYLVDKGGSFQPLTPEDQQVYRADGAWSPDGNQIAYIAGTDSFTNTVDFLPGSLWVTSRNGRNPKQILPDESYLAPIWSRDGASILVTRYLTTTQTFDLYQVNLTSNEARRLGPGVSELIQYPFDRSLFLRWAPDGRRLNLPFDRLNSAPLFYQTPVDVPAPKLVQSQCDFGANYTADWAPTGRALLVSCSDQPMVLRWVYQSPFGLSPAILPFGFWPAWQP